MVLLNDFSSIRNEPDETVPTDTSSSGNAAENNVQDTIIKDIGKPDKASSKVWQNLTRKTVIFLLFNFTLLTKYMYQYFFTLLSILKAMKLRQKFVVLCAHGVHYTMRPQRTSKIISYLLTN